MDMKLNSQLIAKERKSRAWSQQQLADIANLSLRTIQRIENSGNSSPESTKAIASAFDLKANDIILNTNNKSILMRNPKGIAATSLAMFLSICVFAYIALNTNKIIAESTLFSFNGEIRIDDKEYAIGIALPLNSTNIIKLDSNHKLLLITPDDNNENSETEMRLLEQRGSHYGILHSATVIGSKSSSRSFSYRVCGKETTFYNRYLSKIPICGES